MLPQSTFCGLPYNKKSPVPGRSCRAARCKHPHLSRQQPLSEPEKCMRDIERFLHSLVYLFIYSSYKGAKPKRASKFENFKTIIHIF